MLIATLFLNLLILMPLVWVMLSAPGSLDRVFGTQSDARNILTCVYASIALVSAGLIAALWRDLEWAVPATLALFAVQISYKSATLILVGLQSPIVQTNLLVVVVQMIAIATLILRG